ncbi:MAG: DegT/DnrJ/EryC1/StrS aminotransferase family protein [Burkholderiales bacterium]|nr:DegT/DnrJ/EryC1/StrS aminotransferase family protein [Burkholderiales bacterium]
MNEPLIPVYRPDLGGNEKAYVMECLESTWISSKGRFIAEFEQGFARRVGAAHAASVCNGTVALHLALVALGIGPGDEVIVPTLTYIASANAVAYTGATPVFADSLAATWQIDPEDVARKITPRTKAIMAVHLYGHPCDMDALAALCRSHRLFLVEDCAEAIGTAYKGRNAGTFGDVATFSFFGNKTLTTGEGGMVLSSDRTIIERARHFRGQGLAAHREYWHDVVGFNYRMTNICAALGLAQLERLDGFVERKRQIAALYRAGLRGAPVTVHAEAAEATHGYWMVTVLVDDPAERDALRRHLSEHGIETRPAFNPVHTMPMYSHRFQRNPVAEGIAWRGINLPSFPGLSDAEVGLVCAAVHGYYGEQATRRPGLALAA